MTTAFFSFAVLALFMLHEFDEIILVRPWIEQNGADPRFDKELFIAGKKYYPSAEVMALMIAEEFLLAFLILGLACLWPLPELALSLGLCHSLHLLVHLQQALRFRRWVPGSLTALLTLPVLIWLFGAYLLAQHLHWLLVLLFAPLLMLSLLLNLSFLHAKAVWLQERIKRFVS